MGFRETLILGATGRIGQVLQNRWLADGLGDRLLWQGRRAAGLVAAPQVIVDSLADPLALAQAAAGRQILCLAGGIPGRGDLADNWHLAAAALQAASPGQRVILCSSAAVYGNQPDLLDETAPLCPAQPYGRAKVEMEQRAMVLAAQRGLDLCILRIGNIAGLDAILGGWRPGFQLDQFGDGHTPARSYIGMITLARGLAALLALPLLPGVLNLAQPGPVRMGDLLDAAGLAWHPRKAVENSIAQVTLSTTSLEGLIRIPQADTGQLVREWHYLRPHLCGRHSRA